MRRLVILFNVGVVIAFFFLVVRSIDAKKRSYYCSGNIIGFVRPGRFFINSHHHDEVVRRKKASNDHAGSSSSTLYMGKGFNRAKNKQAELAKKMAIAKEEKRIQKDDVSTTTTNNETPNKEQQQQADAAATTTTPPTTTQLRMDDREHEEFAKLLSTTKGAIPTDDDTDSPYIATIKAGQGPKQKIKKKPPKQQKEQLSQNKKTKKEEEEEEIVTSQRIYFESLVDIDTSKPLGPIGAAQLVPWVPPYLTDCLVVFADPRTNSGDLRQTIKYLTSNLQDKNEKFTKQVIFISADSVQETRSWMQRNDITTSIRIFSDTQLEWMTTYNIINNDSRWSMSMLVFDTTAPKNMPQPIMDVDPSHATQMTIEIMEKMAAKQ